MELRDFDFSRCRYSPNAKTFTTNIAKAIPAFAEYKGDKRKQIFQYVVALYDKHSPLWEKEPEYFPRKVLAARLCGLSSETNGGSFNKFTMDILEGGNDDVNKLVTAYLANMGDIEYTQLIADLALYHALFQKQIGGKMLDSAEYKTMQSVGDNIKQRSKTVFGTGPDEELQHVRNLLYQQAEQDRYRMRPEDVVAIVAKDGDVPRDWNPYGADYEVESLTFYQDGDKKG